MSNRIPDKTTDRAAYRRYWRDRRLMIGMAEVIAEVAQAASDTDEFRLIHYKQAEAHLVAALESFKKGHKL